jgi:multimeric flavodoxin WrbA
MSIVILDATKSNDEISKALIREIKKKGVEYSHYILEDMNIQPCRSCGACGFKSPGRCVFDDDMHEILKAIAKCSLIVMVTPVRFGGYSSTLKKAMDRFMALGIPTYMFKNGRLLHPARYGTKMLLVMGIYEGDPTVQTVCFKKLVEHNAFNMQCNYRTVLIEEAEEIADMRRKLEEAFGEVAL